MKYELSRSKVKNYLEAHRSRFSTTEWSDYKSDDICTEFRISHTYGTVLKKNGYVFIKDKKIMLHPSIFKLTEAELHKKNLDYTYYGLKQKKEIEKQKHKKFMDELLQQPFFKNLLEKHKQKNSEINNSVVQTLFEKPDNSKEPNLDELPIKNSNKKITIGFKCSPFLKYRLEKDAETNGITLSTLVHKIINDYINKETHLDKKEAILGTGDKKNLLSALKEKYGILETQQSTESPKALKKLYSESKSNPIKNGYACPKCEKELYDTNPSIVISENTEQGIINKTIVHCDCGFVESRTI